MKNKILLLAIILLYGCSTSEEPKIAENALEVITSHNWRFAELVSMESIDIDGDLIEDILANLNDCNADDRLVFRSDFVYLVDRGDLNCFSDEEQVEEYGTWQYLDEKLTVIGTAKRDINIFEVVCLTSMEISGTVDGVYDPGPDSISFKATYRLRSD